MSCSGCGSEVPAPLRMCGSCLRRDLGVYPRLAPGAVPSGALCKEDALEFCVRPGQAVGFRSEREVGPLPYLRRGIPTDGRIDVVWYCPTKNLPIIAIEVEGRDVAKDSIRNDVGKFRSLRARRNALVLFQVENDSARPKREAGKREGYARRASVELARLGFESAEVLLDTELFVAGGVEKWIQSVHATWTSSLTVPT